MVEASGISQVGSNFRCWLERMDNCIFAHGESSQPEYAGIGSYVEDHV
jgi:hypothetical protein